MHPAKMADLSEGTLARSIEQQIAKLPSDVILRAELGPVGFSLGLHLLGKKGQSNFVGHWAPAFLIVGMYNKFVQVHGSDSAGNGNAQASSASGHYG
jgi:hypothetical protein